MLVIFAHQQRGSLYIDSSKKTLQEALKAARKLSGNGFLPDDRILILEVKEDEPYKILAVRRLAEVLHENDLTHEIWEETFIEHAVKAQKTSSS